MEASRSILPQSVAAPTNIILRQVAIVALLCSKLGAAQILSPTDCSSFNFPINLGGFQTFATKYKPVFTQKNLTADQRLALLKNTVAFVDTQNQNSSNTGVTYAVNDNSAYSPSELKNLNGFHFAPANVFPKFSNSRQRQRLLASSTSLPAAIDWVSAGAVTEVVNQKQCGCCWAIATAGAIEGAAAIQSNFSYLESLSYQQLISCDTTNGGCDGGSTAAALQYGVSNPLGGLATNADFPFNDGSGRTSSNCPLSSLSLAVGANQPTTVTDTNTGDSYATRVALMKQALALGPVTIVMNANCKELQSYSSGVLTDDSSCACADATCLDHALLMVGYNDTNSPPYWKVKNSWGPCWGESGYVRVAQTQAPTGGDFGLFGVLAQGVLPLAAYNATADTSSSMSLKNTFRAAVAGGVVAWALTSLME